MSHTPNSYLQLARFTPCVGALVALVMCAPAPAGELVPCEDLCAELSYRVADDCLHNGNSKDQCLTAALFFLQNCYLDPCQTPDMEVSCTVICEGAGRASARECTMRDGFPELCAEVDRLNFVHCLDDLCQVDLPSLPCEVECHMDAEKALIDCVDDGFSWESCVLAALAQAQLCILEECTPSPGCGSNCMATVYQDRPGDAVFRPTDINRTAPFDPDHRGPIDLLSIRIGGWTPTVIPVEALADAFAGTFTLNADFVRIDLVIRGLVNPPGPLGPGLSNPYRYGSNPLYGFVEIDMDHDIDTGGELATPQFRYLSNVARFGGRSSRPEFFHRVLTDGADLDSDYETPPFIERQGEEFHIALVGNHIAEIMVIDGDTDRQFEAGESWLVLGQHFHRAHGFEPFSFVVGGDVAGEYLPAHPMLFTHDPQRNITRVSLIFPLTQAGAATMRGEPEEPVNSDPTDQASVFEALVDLRESADFILQIAPTGLPEEQIILGWSGKKPGAFLDPRTWSLTALLGTSYIPPGPTNAFFVWTDVFPDTEIGDVDGSGFRGPHDARLVTEWANDNDFRDGVLDQSAPVPFSSSRFSIFDVNYDAVVDHRDVSLSTGDSDQDGDADLRDFARLQLCFGKESATGICLTHDFDRNLSIDNADTAFFRWSMDGPDSQ